MTKKQKKTLKRIIISVVLYLAIILASKLVAIPWYLELVLFLVPYFIIGHDVLRKAVLGIVHGEVFDENFLMAVATVGALCLGEFSESVAVMLFYQIGELFQSYAVGKSRKSISDLMDIRPDSANLETADGTVSTVDPDDVPIGSVLVVRPGEKVPIDGTVVPFLLRHSQLGHPDRRKQASLCASRQRDHQRLRERRRPAEAAHHQAVR